jgi:uncharacterized membrane protein
MQNPQGYGSTTETSSTGLQANVAALLCYIFIPITSIIFYLLEKNSRLVRFHAMQSLLYGVAVFVLFFVFNIFVLGICYVSGILGGLFGLLGLVIWLGFLIGWIFLLIKAYQGQMFKLPVIGNIAEGIVNK